MQIAGFKCVYCSRSIVLEGEGSICSQCGAVAHSQCVEREGMVCISCQNRWVDHTAHRVHATRCPICGSANKNPLKDYCRFCGGRLYFDSIQELNSERKRLHRLGLSQLLASTALGLAGILLLAIAFGARRLSIWSIVMLLLIVITTMIGGVMALFQAFKLARRSWFNLKFN